MPSSEVCTVEKTSGEKMWSYLQRNPGDFDVTFCVGLQKEVVKEVKLNLKSASAILEEEFNEKWECAVSNTTEGIPLPDFDPKAFQLFIKLLILDTWSADALKNLNLRPQDVLNLLQVCRRFGITSAVKHLEAQAEDFIRDFQSYVTTDEFLRMSRANLEAVVVSTLAIISLNTVISSDKIPMAENNLFEAICKWAKFQCRKKKIEATGENVRLVLGGCLFQIRFPLMSTSEFRSIRLKNVLSGEERLAIYDFIALTNQENFDANQTISLHGLGFLGPIDADAKYDVTVEIYSFKTRDTFSFQIDYNKQQKQISALKGKPFYYIFDDPVVLQQNMETDYFGFNLHYSLKDPQLQRIQDLKDRISKLEE